jgi:hypothetical protein
MTPAQAGMTNHAHKARVIEAAGRRVICHLSSVIAAVKEDSTAPARY